MTDRSSVYIAFLDMALAILAVVIVAVNPPKQAEGAPEKAWFLSHRRLVRRPGRRR